jgi:hypothetical protein
LNSTSVPAYLEYTTYALAFTLGSTFLSPTVLPSPTATTSPRSPSPNSPLPAHRCACRGCSSRPAPNCKPPPLRLDCAHNGSHGVYLPRRWQGLELQVRVVSILVPRPKRGELQPGCGVEENRHEAGRGGVQGGEQADGGDWATNSLSSTDGVASGASAKPVAASSTGASCSFSCGCRHLIRFYLGDGRLRQWRWCLTLFH